MAQRRGHVDAYWTQEYEEITYTRCPGERGDGLEDFRYKYRVGLTSPVPVSHSISINLHHSPTTIHFPLNTTQQLQLNTPTAFKMVKIASITFATVALVGQALAATNCTVGQFYCGYTLLSDGKSLPSVSPSHNQILTFLHRRQLPALGAPHHRRPRPPQPARRQRAQDADALLLQRPRHSLVRRVLLLQHAAHVPLPAAVGQRMRTRQQQERLLRSPDLGSGG